MRALLAIFLYAVAAMGGLAAGYYATAPGSAAERSRTREERRVYEQALRHEFAEMEAAATFLAEEERRAPSHASARPAKAEL